jgi:hypothetical protein
MAIYVENTLNEIQSAGGINTQKPVVLSGTAATLAVGGTLAVTGVATFTATPVFTAGIPKGFSTTTADTIAVTAADTGKVYLATKSSATQTFTLPAVAAGLTYTFICGHASGEILVTPTGSVGTVFTTFAAVGADADTAIVTLTTGTGFKNTAATNAIGDSITIISDGVGWYGIGITSGIWATQ